MTGTDQPVGPLADRIAARGREALVARLRAAYLEAAGAHSDIVSIDDERIEAMVQSAADRADGLQWRRALAGVAAEELGIDLTEALSHPAVAAAQQQLGAPSYEDSLAQLIAQPVPEPPRRNGSAPVAEPEPVADEPEPEPVADEPEPEPVADEPEPEPVADEPEPEPVADEPEPEPEPEPVATNVELAEQTPAEEPQPTVEHPLPPLAPQLPGDDVHHDEVPLLDAQELPPHEPEEDQLRVSALHLGGVANLPIGEEGLDIRLSSDGLDIMHETDEIIGRLSWSEIDELEVPSPRGRLRRSSRGRARMTVRTRHGDASFEIPAFSSDELRERIEPLIDRYGGF